MRTTSWRRRLVRAGLALTAMLIPATAGLVAGPALPAQAASCPSNATRLNVVAHQDDDILFINPDIDADIRARRCVITVFVTAGDAGRPDAYWRGREAGAMAAYSKMANKPNRWTGTTGNLQGHQVLSRTLDGSRITLFFLRLPADGNSSGYPDHRYETIGKLRNHTMTTIQAVDGSATWTDGALRDALTQLMTIFKPSIIRTLDYAGKYTDGDHADHHNAAYYTYEAQQSYTTPHTLQGFRGYPMSKRPANLSATAAAAKLAIFLAYAPHDSNVCQSTAKCRKNKYWPWFSREYQL